MKIKAPRLRRSKYLLASALLAVTAVLPSFLSASVSAEQITSRSIKMSNSAAGQTGVSYEVSFKPGSSYSIEGIVVDFCKDSPIIGYSTCTSPGGSFALGASPSVTTGGSLTGTWTAGQLNSQRTLTLTNATGVSVTTASTLTFTVSGVTNPTPSGADHTFYARIYTYSDSALPPAYTVAAPGAYEDAGGIALSTANAVSVSGTVQETLEFCVANALITDCSTLDSNDVPVLELGEGTPKVLETNARSTSSAYSRLSTNAGGGATIRMKSSNDCGGLSKNNGTTCEIAPATSTDPINAGTAKFGVNVSSSGMTVPALYGTASNYGVEWASDDSLGVTSLYGSQVASSTGVLNGENTTYTFAASIDNTIPAGVYTANIVLMATGTY